jgi:hypothetical protein
VEKMVIWNLISKNRPKNSNSGRSYPEVEEEERTLRIGLEVESSYEHSHET